MSNDYYNHGSYPSTGAAGSSSAMRAELDAVTTGFGKLPVLAASALKLVRVNAGATALESTSLIDGITIGSVTPAPGTFTTLSATGNVIIGDNIADTITIGGGSSKSATGNWVFAAPTAGTAVTVSPLAGQTAIAITNAATGPVSALSITDGTITSSWQANNGTISTLGTTSNHPLNLMTNAASRISIAAAGNVTIIAPSSGATVNIGQVAASNALETNVALSGGIAKWALSNSSNTASSDARQVLGVAGASAGDAYTVYDNVGVVSWAIGFDNSDGDKFKISRGALLGTTDVLSIDTGGSVTIAAPSSGTTLTASYLPGGTVMSVTDGTLTSQWKSSAGIVRIGTTSADPFAIITQDGIRVQVAAAGNVSFAAPSSGTSLSMTMAAAVSTVGILQTPTTLVLQYPFNSQSSGANSFAIEQSADNNYRIGMTTAHSFTLMTSNVSRLAVSSAGSVTIAAPSSGKPLAIDGETTVASSTATPAGGTAGKGLTFGTTTNLGVFFGSGAPTLSAAKGSLYLRSDGTTTNDRMYVNTNGTTTWTAVTTVA